MVTLVSDPKIAEAEVVKEKSNAQKTAEFILAFPDKVEVYVGWDQRNSKRLYDRGMMVTQFGAYAWANDIPFVEKAVADKWIHRNGKERGIFTTHDDLIAHWIKEDDPYWEHLDAHEFQVKWIKSLRRKRIAVAEAKRQAAHELFKSLMSD